MSLRPGALDVLHLWLGEQRTLAERQADRLGIHRTTLRTLALAGEAPVEPVLLTRHKRVYRRIDVQRLAGLEK